MEPLNHLSSQLGIIENQEAGLLACKSLTDHNEPYKIQVQSIPQILIATKFIAFCPLCLREKDAVSPFWTATTSTHCPSHGVLLNDKCEISGELIRLEDLSAGISNSGHMLATQSESLVSEQGHKIARLSVALLNREPSDTSFWKYFRHHGCQFMDFVTVILLVVALMGNGRVSLNLFSSRRSISERASLVLAAAPYILDSNFPARLFGLFDEYKNRVGSKSATCFTVAFPRIATFTNRNRRDALPKTLLTALFADYLDKHYPEYVPVCSLQSTIFQILNARHDFITSEKIRDATGANPKIIERSAARSKIKIWKAPGDNKTLYSQKDLKILQNEISKDPEYSAFEDAIGIKEVAHQIGTSGKVINFLVTEGIFEAVALGRSRRYPVRIPRSSLNEFIQEIQDKASTYSNVGFHSKSRCNLHQAANDGKFSIKSLILNIIREELTFNLSDDIDLPLLKRIWISKSELRKLDVHCEARQSDHTGPLFSSRVERILGCRKLVLTELLERGILKFDRDINSKKGNAICPQSFDHFCKNFLTMKMLKERMGIERISQRTLEKKFGINPRYEFKKGRRTTYIYSIAQLEKLKITG
tara:strand:+ start:2774 stop:4543 length:1770 start_codon:yes stop_codon:yes gene_type:complete